MLLLRTTTRVDSAARDDAAGAALRIAAGGPEAAVIRSSDR